MFISAIQIYRMIKNYGVTVLDIALLGMQLVMKVTYAAWAIHDLTLFREGKIEKPDNLISRYPSMVEYFAYNFGFIGIVGPTTNLNDYLNWLDRKVRSPEIPSNFIGQLRKHQNELEGPHEVGTFLRSVLYSPYCIWS
jgi:hypothetical protein